jgi:hypothetical protein
MNATAAGHDEAAVAVFHNHVRLAAAVTAAFVVCEVMQWAPSFLGAVFAVVLLANLPARPPLKLTAVLILVMLAASWSVYVMTSALAGTPAVLWGTVALFMFLAFHALVSGKQALPQIFLVICLTAIPVAELTAPTSGSGLATALSRGLAVGLLFVQLGWLLWPRTSPRAPPMAGGDSVVPPLTRALISTAVVLPVMLLYLLFGWIDVMPVLIATVLIVLTFDPAASRAEAIGRIVANFAGGLLGFLLHAVLLTTPSVTFMALLLFLTLLVFARYIYAGGLSGKIAMVACNAMLIIFSSAISAGTGSLSLWLVRLFQFALAGAFAVGLMELLWHFVVRRKAGKVAP